MCKDWHVCPNCGEEWKATWFNEGDCGFPKQCVCKFCYALHHFLCGGKREVNLYKDRKMRKAIPMLQLPKIVYAGVSEDELNC